MTFSVSAIEFSFAYFVDMVTGITMAGTTAQAVNVWVFVDIFNPSIWACLVTTLVMIMVSFVAICEVNGDGGRSIPSSLLKEAFNIGNIFLGLGIERQVNDS